MSVTYSAGWSRTLNRSVVASTFALSAIGLCLLVGRAITTHSVHNPSFIIYGASLFVCCLCSFMYTRRLDDQGSRVWRHLDHAAIFILIAGTYTPFVVGIDGPLGVGLTWWAWALATLGVTLRLLLRNAYARLFVLLYIAIGWLFVTALPEILARVNEISLLFLAAGAVSYTIGALLFAKDIGRWTDPVWHTFVLGGCALHFLAVLALLSAGL